jgi:hypothetical protein
MPRRPAPAAGRGSSSGTAGLPARPDHQHAPGAPLSWAVPVVSCAAHHPAEPSGIILPIVQSVACAQHCVNDRPRLAGVKLQAVPAAAAAGGVRAAAAAAVHRAAKARPFRRLPSLCQLAAGSGAGHTDRDCHSLEGAAPLAPAPPALARDGALRRQLPRTCPPRGPFRGWRGQLRCTPVPVLRLATAFWPRSESPVPQHRTRSRTPYQCQRFPAHRPAAPACPDEPAAESG